VVRPARITADIRIDVSAASSRRFRSCFRVLLNASRVNATASRDHRLIEKRSCKRRDSNEPSNYRNVSFSLSSAACFLIGHSRIAFPYVTTMFHLVSSFVLIVTQWQVSGSSALIGFGGRFTARIVFEKRNEAAANAILTGGSISHFVSTETVERSSLK
jgi:hypothetical protein